MPQHTAPRQPLSCENCRKRKIKCSGAKVPCHTCVKRGHAQSCYYKRLATSPPLAAAGDSELLQRIRNLEDMLKQHVHRESCSSSESTPINGTTDSNKEYAHRRENQIGVVISTTTGHQIFRPLSKAMEPNHVQELIEVAPLMSSPFPSTNFPFSPDPTNVKSLLLDSLPPLRQCDELKDVFFQVFSPLFHILHDPTFDVGYWQFREDPSSTSLSWLALLFVILAIAVTALEDDHPLLRDLGRESSPVANMKNLSAKYRSSAMQCLSADQFLHQHNLNTVQALVLLIYALNHANISSWALLGLTWNISVAIGCHVDPSQLGLEVIESEERRRAWAGLMMLYTIQSTCLGQTSPQLVNNAVDLPADRDDGDLLHTSLDGQSSLPTKMSYILYKFRLYKIAAEICEYSLQWSDNRKQLMDLDMKLLIEENEHNLRFSSQNLPVHHVVHHYILKSYLNHLCLLLHRPSLNRSNIIFRSQNLSEDGFQSQQRCKNAAFSILEVHGHLYDSLQYRPYRWYVYGLGSFHAFQAVSTLIVLSNTVKMSDDDSFGLRMSIEQCLQRFEAMSGRSDICAKASTILRRTMQAIAMKNPHAASHIEVYLDSGVTPQTSTIGQFPLSPTSNPEQGTSGPCDWTANPELETLFFDMAPEQWLAPTNFRWDKWANIGMMV